MPTPSPIIVASTGATDPISVNDAMMCTIEMPTPRPNSAVRIGQPHRDDRAEREQQDHDRGEQTDEVGVARGGWSA